ncbi:1-phosphofructokinase family hexose kinase [Poriferisphaera sp. WC338]|uniref:1-phosphofructokinase family hexose kinase n=1 Tax=Poriferisphaera sp. WC338 TaxID=3425129 RepID=UPI003D819CC1
MGKELSIVTVTLNTAIDRVLEADNFAVGGHVRANQKLRYPAGKGINVSRTLARLGWQNVATGYIGETHAAEYNEFLRSIKPGRINNQLLAVRGATRENITVLDPVNHTDTHIRTEGYEISEHVSGRIISKVGLLARQGTMIVFSGSLPPGMTVTDYNTLVYVAISAGSQVVLDVDGDVLKSLVQIGTGDHAETKPFFMVKPNLHELEEMLGIGSLQSEDEIVAAAKQIAGVVQWVVVTLGEGGAIMISPDGAAWRGRCDVLSEEVQNTVGCGDTMLAGMIDGQMRDAEPEEVLRRALALATANAMEPGVAEYELSLVAELETRTQVVKI